jgi:Spy/CpxP family protein refolding chaperone
MAQFRSTDDPSREQMRQARNEAIRLLVAEPFDEAAYERQLLKVDELRRQRTKRMSDEMKELVKGLPPEQRTAVGEMLKRPAPPA